MSFLLIHVKNNCKRITKIAKFENISLKSTKIVCAFWQKFIKMTGYFFKIYFSMCDLAYNKVQTINRRMNYRTLKMGNWKYTNKAK
jgi:hypothetical protein